MDLVILLLFRYYYFFCLGRLEELVKKQNAELEELRQRVQSANTASTSGRGSLTPEETQGTTLASSGRGTALCHRGTDPLYEWPERPSTCTRSTSPGPFSNMTSPEESRNNVTGYQELEEEKKEDFNENVVGRNYNFTLLPLFCDHFLLFRM